MTELEALLILNAVPGIGNVTIRKILDHYGSAAKVLSLSDTELISDQIIPEKIIHSISSFPKDDFLKNELQLMAQKQVHVITFRDNEYPPPLNEIPDAPVLLYVHGRIPENIFLSMAIVGSRRASLYGLSVAEQFAGRLAELGFTIVSGMARGIDTAAHQGALKAHGATVAVLGCGLAHVYPPENEGLMEKIAASGAVVSEFPVQTLPFAHNFPRRNRIISGLSLGVLIAEAAEKSGALITADCALEQGKEVFAVPGKIDSPTSRGVHHLIKQGAKLIVCVEDILEELKPHLLSHLKRNDVPAAEEEQKADDKLLMLRLRSASTLSPSTPLGMVSKQSASNHEVEGLTEQERFIYEQMGDRPVHIDELTHRCGLTTPLTTAVLMQMELKRLIRQLPGKWFTR